MNHRMIVLIGKTGSGKSVQGKALAQRLRVDFISSGDIARAMAKDDEDTKVALDHGLPAPEQQMRTSIQAALGDAAANSGGFVLDGFPRNVAQLIELLNWLPSEPVFFLLDISDLDAVTRLLDRKRPDDNADAIARKLRSFRTDTQEMIDLLEAGNALFTIDAARRRDRITESLMARIDQIEQQATRRR